MDDSWPGKGDEDGIRPSLPLIVALGAVHYAIVMVLIFVVLLAGGMDIDEQPTGRRALVATACSLGIRLLTVPRSLLGIDSGLVIDSLLYGTGAAWLVMGFRNTLGRRLDGDSR
jgi:hypothetical protein